MIAMLSRNATLRVLAESGSGGAPPRAAGRTSLPRATNNSSAAIVAQVVITWLPARRTVLLLALLNLRSTSWSPPAMAGRSEFYPTLSSSLWFGLRKSLLGKAKRLGNCPVGIEIARIQQQRIEGGPERSD